MRKEAPDTVAVKLENVTFAPNGKTVLDNINLEIKSERIFTLIGRTGSGKSTVLRMINRLSDPDSGDVFVNGKNIKKWDVRMLRRVASLIPQSYSLPNIEISEILKYACQILCIKYDEEQMIKMLSDVELPAEVLLKKSGNLSGGERQRVAICRTLLADPKILLADEPTANLDPASALMVAKLLHDFSHDGKTVVWVTHDPILASKFTDSGVLLAAGKIVAEGDLKELAEREEYRR